MSIFWKILYNVIIPLFAIGMVVFIHELGHFLVAKKRGIVVEKFSIGFGPKLFSFERNGTEYKICLILFGGFVKFLGDDISDSKDDLHTVKGGFYAASPLTRIYACFAGPLMNIFLGFIIYCFIFWLGKPMLIEETWTSIGQVLPESAAEKGGLLPGDTIKIVNGKEVSSWRDLVYRIALSSKKELSLVIERDGNQVLVNISPEIDKQSGVRLLGIAPQERIKVKDIIPDSPAQKGGLLPGDIISAINGMGVYRWDALTSQINENKDQEVILTILRNGSKKDLVITPHYDEDLDRATIGFIKDFEIITVHPNPFVAVYDDVRNVYMTLYALFTRKVSAKGVAGPLGIIHVMGEHAKIGLKSFLALLALISVNLGIVNLLPIPVLDGGHILFSLLELFRRKPLNQKTMIVIQNIFVSMIVVIILLVSYNDVKKMLSGFFNDEEAASVKSSVVHEQQAQQK